MSSVPATAQRRSYSRSYKRRVVVVEAEVGSVLDGTEEQAVEVLRGGGVERGEQRADRVLLGVALLHADLHEGRLAEVLVEEARQVLQQDRLAVPARVGVEDRRLRPQGAEALAVVDGAEDELADRFIELLGLDLGAEEATVLTVVSSAEDSDGLCGERVAFETPLVADPGDGGQKGEGHCVTPVLSGLGDDGHDVVSACSGSGCGEDERRRGRRD